MKSSWTSTHNGSLDNFVGTKGSRKKGKEKERDGARGNVSCGNRERFSKASVPAVNLVEFAAESIRPGFLGQSSLAILSAVKLL